MDEPKKLRRPRQGRMLAGVCAAFANYFGLDPTVVRVAYVLLTIFTTIITGCLHPDVIPEEPNPYYRNANRRTV